LQSKFFLYFLLSIFCCRANFSSTFYFLHSIFYILLPHLIMHCVLLTVLAELFNLYFIRAFFFASFKTVVSTFTNRTL